MARTGGTAVKCSNCGHDKEDVWDRIDWRKAARPDRTKIQQPIGSSMLCWQCEIKIMDEFAPIAPTFDKRGNRIYP